jgi:hypothetical protein
MGDGMQWDVLGSSIAASLSRRSCSYVNFFGGLACRFDDRIETAVTRGVSVNDGFALHRNGGCYWKGATLGNIAFLVTDKATVWLAADSMRGTA